MTEPKRSTLSLSGCYLQSFLLFRVMIKLLLVHDAMPFYFPASFLSCSVFLKERIVNITELLEGLLY